MIAIVDYGVGNLFSLESSFAAIGAEVRVTADAGALRTAERIVLPGVGAFGDAAEKLRSSGLAAPLLEEARQGKPILGICLGMQLLFERSFEYGEHEGLGLIPGEVRPITEIIPLNAHGAGLKVPHIGWNALHLITGGGPLFTHVGEGDCVYFVHSYSAHCPGEFVTATAEYGAELTAAVQRGNVYGCQFHPEKSGAVGLNILRAFTGLNARAAGLAAFDAGGASAPNRQAASC
ncbi:MAG: imidazole glycerol phosphate synthase subunit HisH [Fretibacterium sp.]|nr:imidazole glycerol phosphate synthase subunit HisH [Fretibacterium sp.]